MKRYLLVLAALALLLIFWFYSTTKSKLISATHGSAGVAAVATNSSRVTLDRHSSPIIVASNKLTSKPTEEPPDILAATNLEQWKSLIKDLKQDATLRDNWMTSRFRRGAPPVVLKHNGQSIIYAAEAIDVMVIPNTADFMEAQIYSPKMNIDETRELGLKLCGMFGFEPNKFLACCTSNSVGNNWADPPLVGVGDYSHFFNVRASFNKEKPLFIIFTIQQESAVLKLLREPPH